MVLRYAMVNLRMIPSRMPKVRMPRMIQSTTKCPEQQSSWAGSFIICSFFGGSGDLPLIDLASRMGRGARGPVLGHHHPGGSQHWGWPAPHGGRHVVHGPVEGLVVQMWRAGREPAVGDLCHGPGPAHGSGAGDDGGGH